MAKRFHVNPKTGDPNICRAVIYCPFAPPSGHYATKEEAREAYEAKNSTHTLSKISKKPKTLEVIEIHDTLASLPRYTENYTPEDHLKGESVFRCSECDKPFSNSAAGLLLYYENVRCRHCGELGDINSASLEVREDFRDIEVDVNNAKKRRWTHATGRGAAWFKGVQEADVSIHMGAPEAAVDRMLTEYNNVGDRTVYFYELELKEEVALQPTIEEDQTNGDRVKNHENPALVYLNRWEAPGTLSVEAHHSQVKVVAVHKVNAPSLKEIVSLYTTPGEAIHDERLFARGQAS